MSDLARKYITQNPAICGGRPTFKGTRVPVSVILELIESGMSEKDILRGYPSLNKNAIKAGLEYAVERIENEEFIPFVAK